MKVWNSIFNLIPTTIKQVLQNMGFSLFFLLVSNAFYMLFNYFVMLLVLIFFRIFNLFIYLFIYLFNFIYFFDFLSFWKLIFTFMFFFVVFKGIFIYKKMTKSHVEENRRMPLLYKDILIHYFFYLFSKHIEISC
jgi:hypothetical protein